PDQPLASVSLQAGDVAAPLLEFDAVQPARLPEVPRLALEATFEWRRMPDALPPGARPAELVRRWTAVDEWATRAVDTLSKALDELEHQRGQQSLLRRLFGAQNAATAERRALADELVEIAETRPSQSPEHAASRLQRLVAIA